MNTLYYGDNLKILREYIERESVDLIYLDPPFNSNRNYNVLFRDESGADSDSKITAFEDTWHWNHTAEETYHELLLAGDDVSTGAAGMEPPVITGGLAKPTADHETPKPDAVASGSPPLTSGGSTTASSANPGTSTERVSLPPKTGTNSSGGRSR